MTSPSTTLTPPPGLLQENDEIRCASILLLGNLSQFGSGEAVFKDQIHNVLVSLLLHLVDPNPHVVKVPSQHSPHLCPTPKVHVPPPLSHVNIQWHGKNRQIMD